MGKAREFLSGLKDKLGSNEKIIAKGTGIAFLGIIAVNVGGFLLLFAKTRFMSTSAVGMLTLARSIVVMAFILTHGFAGAVFRYASMFNSDDRNDKVKGVITTAYKYALPLFFLIFVLVFVFAENIALNIFHKPGLIMLIRILSFVSLFNSISMINIALLRSKFLNKYGYIVDVAVQLLTLLFVYGLFISGRRNFLMMFTSAWAVASFIVMVKSFFIVKREFPFLFDKSLKARENKKKIFIYAVITQVTSLLIRFRLEINVFIMALFLKTSDIALYHVAFQLGRIGSVILEGLNSIFPAVVGKLYGEDKICEIKEMHKRTAKILFCISVIVFFLFVVFGKFILGIFSPVYRQAFIPLLIIAFSFIIESGVGSAGGILNMMGKPHYNTAYTLVALVLTVVLCYTLIPLYGIVGAAAAFAISNITKRILMLLGVLWVYKRKENGVVGE